MENALNPIAEIDTNVIKAASICTGALKAMEGLLEETTDYRLFALQAAIERAVELLDEADEMLEAFEIANR